MPDAPVPVRYDGKVIGPPAKGRKDGDVIVYTFDVPKGYERKPYVAIKGSKVPKKVLRLIENGRVVRK